MIRYVYSLFHYILFSAGPSNAAKKKKREETSSISEVSSQKTDAEENAQEKFAKKTKIPNSKTKQGKDNSNQVKQSGQAGTPVKRGRKPNNPIILKKKPTNAFYIKDHFKSGYQSDARKLPKPRDSLVNYRLIVSDKKWITLTNNQYEYNEETQKVFVYLCSQCPKKFSRGG